MNTLRRAIAKTFATNNKLLRILRADQGLTIVEYAVAAGLIVAAVAVSFGVLGAAVNGVIVFITAAL